MARLAINKINLYSTQYDIAGQNNTNGAGSIDQSNNFHLQSISLESDRTYSVQEPLAMNEDTLFINGSSID